MDIDTDRLNSLLKATIVSYYDEINPDEELDLYDKMLVHLVKGDFDNVFKSTISDDNKEKKYNSFLLARKYSRLCFFQENENYWTDSIEGVGVLDVETLCKRILSNYNFLLEVAYENGEEALKELSILKDSSLSKKSSIIDYLRNTFLDDELLKRILGIISLDKDYNKLDISNKEVLMKYPQGTLYYEDEGKLIICDWDYLVNKIKEYDSSLNIKELKDINHNKEISNVIRSISLDYQGLFSEENHKML